MGNLAESSGKQKAGGGGKAQKPTLFKSSEFGAKKEKKKRTPEERQAKRAEIVSGIGEAASTTFGGSENVDRFQGLGEGFSSVEGGAVNLALFGGIATLGAAEAAVLERKARNLELQARQVSLLGATAAINESIRANTAIGSQVVASSAALTGTSAGAALAEFEGAKTNINILRLDAEQRAVLLREQASRAKKTAKFKRKFGGFTAAVDVAGGVVGLAT